MYLYDIKHSHLNTRFLFSFVSVGPGFIKEDIL